MNRYRYRRIVWYGCVLGQSVGDRRCCRKSPIPSELVTYARTVLRTAFALTRRRTGLVFCVRMQLHSADPTYTRSERARDNFRLAAKLSIGFVAILWLIPLLGWDLELERFGVRPRQWLGLPGILVAPLLHAGFIHLIANTLPLLVLGTTMLHLYPTAAFRVLSAVYLGPGIAVWLLARDGNHVGASGLVYGLVSYIFVAGLIRRDRRAIAASLLVAFMYGTLVWGVLPIRNGVSWETHLAAALIGASMAIALRHADIPPRTRYSWEGETDDDPDETKTPIAIAGQAVEASVPATELIAGTPPAGPKSRG